MNKRKYITGIDGLRSIAVIGVILYHLIPDKMPGGYLGVTLFFVISGYLMTDILLNQWESRGKISLKSFYFKRARRIYPSLIMMFVISGSSFLFLSKDLLQNLKQIFTTSLLNINNIWQIFNGSSYFDRFGNESAFTHLWSLSIEGQFYIIWPIILALLIFKRKDYQLLKNFILVGIIVSGLLMAFIYQPESINRVYYGTDTRIFSILMGAYLAIFLREKDEIVQKLDNKYKMSIFIISLVLVLLGLILIKDNWSFTYRGGMFLFSLCSSILLGTIIVSSQANEFLTNSLFKWIGTRSYEIYLWQFPVMIVYEKTIKWNGDHSFIHLIIQLILILLLSEVTYRIIQLILFDIDWKKTNIDGTNRFENLTESLNGKLAVGLILTFTISFTYALVSAPSGRSEESIALQKKLEKNKELISKPKTSESKPKTKEKTTDSTTKKTESSTKETSLITLTNEESEFLKGKKISAIGDSLLLSAAPELQQVFPNNFIDAEVGRQFMNSEDVFKKTNKEDKMGDIVIIVLGTNGSFTSSDVDNVMKQVGNKPAFFVNTMVQKPWQKTVNTELEKTADRFDNAHVIDWKKYSEGYDNWFDGDNVHLTPDGAVIFANFVGKEIYDVLK